MVKLKVIINETDNAMKIFNSILKIVLALLLVSPIVGALGVFPPPTPDLYNTPEAFAFIEALMNAKYLNILIALVFFVGIVALVTRRTALAALIILPVTINILAFHLFLDGGIFTGGAVMADLLFALNLYFLWLNRNTYAVLLNKN